MKDRKYTVGLARDLSKRINKLDDNFPVYYKAFNTEQQMIVVYNMVLEKLYEYREKESKDSQENNNNYFLERHKILNIYLIFY